MQRELRRNIQAFGITSLFNDISSEMAYWILPAFIVTIGGGPAQLGVIEGIAESVASLGKLASGYITDALPRRKPIVAGGYAIANLVKPLLAFATVWWHVLLVRFTDRTLKGLRGTPRDVMLAESADVKKLGSAFGFVQAADSAGAILGPLIAWWMLRGLHTSMRTVFLAAAVPGALCVLAVAFFTRETGSARDLQQIAAVAPRRPLPRPFWLVLGAVLVFQLGNSSDMFLVLRARDAGIAVAFAPLLGLVFNVTYTFASWPAGALSDRVSRHKLAAVGYLIFAATYATFALAPLKLARFHAELAVWCAMGFYGLYYALTEPVLKALVVASVSKDERGRAVGIYSFVSSVCVLFASAATGFLWRRFGGQLPLGASAGLAVIAALLLLTIGGSERARA